MRRGYLSLGIKDIFDPKGRIDRLTYFMYGAILAIINVVCNAAITLGLSVVSPSLLEDASIYIGLISVILLLPLLYGQFCIRAKRLHDLNMPAFIALFGFSDIIVSVSGGIAMGLGTIPEHMEPGLQSIVSGLSIAVLVFHLLLLFIPGTRGSNRYGINNLGDSLPKPKILEG